MGRGMRAAVAAASVVAAVAAGADPGGEAQCVLSMEDGQLRLDGKVWLSLGKPCARSDGEEWCAGDTAARNLRSSGGGGSGGDERRGRDAIGAFHESMHTLEVGSNKRRWEITLRDYADHNAMVFEQHFKDGMSGTQAVEVDLENFAPEDKVPNDVEMARDGSGLASWYPAFRVSRLDSAGPRGTIRVNGHMSGANFVVEDWEEGLRKLNPNESGPVAIFSEECVVVISSASAFMASSNAYDADKGELGFGVMGSVDEIPAGHRAATIVSASPRRGPDGIRRAFAEWGALLRKLYKLERARDVTVEYLQWSTDNGAYNYYYYEPYDTYEDLVVGVADRARERGIPFRQWLMDSWWYFKGTANGVKNWTAMESVFPNGIQSVTDSTRWEVVAHNRYWSSNTDYAKQNGGDYDFAIEGDLALPLEQRFWDDLLSEAKLWGLTVYEQDWMYNQFRGMTYTTGSVSHARTWLLQMGAAAANIGINIQYCMSWPRHVMQSLEVPAVTQVRASDDYQPSNGQWRPLGVTSMFSHALGLMPSKDNFWSNATLRAHGRYGGRHEKEPVVHAIVSTLSTGPVAPSDEIDSLDVDLVMRSCASNGRLLQPDVPAVLTDRALLARIGIAGYSKSNVEIWSTYVSLSGFVYSYIMAAGAPDFEIGKADVYEGLNAGYVAWDTAADTFEPVELPAQVPETDGQNPSLFAVAPVFQSGWALLGEATTKWVPVSGGRFSGLEVTDTGFTVSITGEPGEVVHLIVRTPDKKYLKTPFRVPSSGSARWSTGALSAAAEHQAVAI